MARISVLQWPHAGVRNPKQAGNDDGGPQRRGSPLASLCLFHSFLWPSLVLPRPVAAPLPQPLWRLIALKRQTGAELAVRPVSCLRFSSCGLPFLAGHRRNSSGGILFLVDANFLFALIYCPYLTETQGKRMYFVGQRWWYASATRLDEARRLAAAGGADHGWESSN